MSFFVFSVDGFYKNKKIFLLTDSTLCGRREKRLLFLPSA